jgi:hypothetical protein
MDRAEEASPPRALAESAAEFVDPNVRAWLWVKIGAGEKATAIRDLLPSSSRSDAELTYDLATRRPSSATRRAPGAAYRAARGATKACECQWNSSVRPIGASCGVRMLRSVCAPTNILRQLGRKTIDLELFAPYCGPAHPEVQGVRPHTSSRCWIRQMTKGNRWEMDLVSTACSNPTAMWRASAVAKPRQTQFGVWPCGLRHAISVGTEQTDGGC